MIQERLRAGLTRLRDALFWLGWPPIAPALEKRIREALATPAPASAGLVAAMQAGGCRDRRRGVGCHARLNTRNPNSRRWLALGALGGALPPMISGTLEDGHADIPKL